jgi:valyl-tRNA synthetase
MGDIDKARQKLENKQFVENAPEEVVEEHRTRKQEAESTMNKLSQALKQLDCRRVMSSLPGGLAK